MTGRPINALELYRTIKDQWDTTSQPLKERATILPLGQYEDGSVGLAWPGLLAAPAEGMVNFGRYGYDSPEAIRDNARSAFDVAGGAVTGGLGVGLAGGLADNAVGSAGAKLTGNALERQPQGIRAYHGSPHDFDRFSLDKIGTGEGWQGQGYGLYFGEAEGTAKWYRDQLNRDTPIKYGKETLSTDARNVWGNNNYDLDAAIKDAQRMVSDAENSNVVFVRARRQMFQNIADELMRAKEAGGISPPGRSYEVNINANKDDFLDWDKLDDATRAKLNTPSGAREAAANGIPGVRYLDAVSRSAGTGTSNYVVFDDALIDILRKYSNAPTGSSVPLAVNALEKAGSRQNVRIGEVNTTGKGNKIATIERDGVPIGRVNYFRSGDEIFINSMGTEGGSNSLGVAGLRQLRELLRDIEPGATKFGGDRAYSEKTGAAKEGAKKLNQSGRAQSVYIPANAPTAAALPLAADTQDTDPALLEYLRLTGQLPY